MAFLAGVLAGLGLLATLNRSILALLKTRYDLGATAQVINHRRGLKRELSNPFNLVRGISVSGCAIKTLAKSMVAKSYPMHFDAVEKAAIHRPKTPPTRMRLPTC